MTSFNESQLQERISRTWDESIVPSLVEYIKIPNKSPSFEPAWQELGHMGKGTSTCTRVVQKQYA